MLAAVSSSVCRQLIILIYRHRRHLHGNAADIGPASEAEAETLVCKRLACGVTLRPLGLVTRLALSRRLCHSVNCVAICCTTAKQSGALQDKAAAAAAARDADCTLAPEKKTKVFLVISYMKLGRLC